MAAESSSAAAMAEELTLTVKWSGKEYTVRVCGDDSVAELKRRICEVTNVLPKRQKLLYPKIGNKLADDTVILSQLSLKSSLKMTMIGFDYPLFSSSIKSLTVEDDIIVDPVDDPEIVDDFELGQDEAVEIKDKEVNKMKLKRRTDQYKVKFSSFFCYDTQIQIKQPLLEEATASVSYCRIFLPSDDEIKLRNPCREGKKLLVLDIDYTLFDHRSTAENPMQLMRPYLHEFLTAAYTEYDIMIWSATRYEIVLYFHMKWVELKMGELGVLSNPNYKITALLDHLAMITVQSDARGIFDCKPLGLIWAHFPEFYSKKNTIMFDDLRRNFVMNPKNGLTIKPFRKAHANRDSDQELVKLTEYLLAIAELDDISKLDHSKWKYYAEDGSKRRRHA
ncbi:unnamed protein product [Linum tenue]|uniref:protein-serine/threonine phosphatase n=1 Tax=Linum tenue TaxID=586396 RepID=A0AAV0M0C9_9ROSI|nr:unnamed protein product [Linum tenue]